eukprot:TRINITY_DN3309_c0_g1_i1.p1 TRINITY_DN3309_c0_g1~~TRINITY_DN3309_c0_g1_i1.p1  ORF type:complete len:476 (-),score=76.95 TRINITY_DN3309_c0_g1_i1:178-1566(-)
MFQRSGKPTIKLENLAIPLMMLFMFSFIVLVFVMGSTNFAVVIPKLICLNPMVRTKRFEDKRMPSVWALKQAHVHQRAFDRWLDAHDAIQNSCWPGQINSSYAPFARQCSYNSSSLWAPFEPSPDPYSIPARGACSPGQLTKEGILHAEKLGAILRKQYIEKLKIVPADCPFDRIALELDQDQKNQLTLQHEYFGLCGRYPSLVDYPASKVLNTGRVEKNRPFWLSTGVCNSTKFNDLYQESLDHMYQSSFWKEQVKNNVTLIARYTGQSAPVEEHRAEFLDGINECLIIHQCHNLTDYPAIFREGDDVYHTSDTLDTKIKMYPYDYYANDDAKYNEFSSLYFGYYYKVLWDRMYKMKSNVTNVKSLYVQVTSDAIVAPQLRMLGVTKYAGQRPPFGSTMIYELYQHKTEREQFAVRILFNGHTVKACGNKGYCTWEEWTNKLTKFFPKKQDCAPFYNNYQG